MQYARIKAVMMCACLSAGCGDGGRAPLGIGAAALATSARGFTAELGGCDEFVGSTLIPLAAARSRVPASYGIAEAAPDQATLFVRASRCEAVDIDGEGPRPAIVSEGGVAITAPDGTGDINIYTLWFATDDVALAARLKIAGFDVKLIPSLGYEYTLNEAGSGGTFSAGAHEPAALAYQVTGFMTEPTPVGFPLTVNWWLAGRHGAVQIGTDIPEIHHGGADVSLSTKPGSQVGQILGGSTTTFPAFRTHGRFEHAFMSVDIVAP